MNKKSILKKFKKLINSKVIVKSYFKTLTTLTQINDSVSVFCEIILNGNYLIIFHYTVTFLIVSIDLFKSLNQWHIFKAKCLERDNN